MSQDPRKLHVVGEPDRAPVSVTVVVDDVEYDLRNKELNAIDIGEFRKQAGTTQKDLWLSIFGLESDIDTVAQIMWLSIRQSGNRRIRYEVVAERITQEGAEAGRYEIRLPDPDLAAAPVLSAVETDVEEVGELDPPD